jgi:hypothetical protein
MGFDAARRENAVKIGLILFFIAFLFVFTAITGTERISQVFATLGFIDFVLFGLATFRLGRLVAFDRVMEPLRSPVARTVQDLTGAGNTVEPKGEGGQQAIGQLITCPICVGTWIAAGMVYALIWYPEITRLFIWMTGAVGLAEILNALTEMLCWVGQRNRVMTGRNPPKQE